MQKDFSPAIYEILDYLHGCTLPYAIWAGFAGYLLVGAETSADVDIFTASEADTRQISAVMQQAGWVQTTELWETKTHLNISLAKADAEFDLIYTEHAAKNLLNERMRVDYAGRQLYTLSTEAMLLVKINQMTKPDRPVDKVARDREVIRRLRGKIDSKKIAALAARMGERYWTDGRF